MGMLDAVHDVQRRFETFNRRMAPGFLGGRTEVASPVSAQARGIATPATRPSDPAGGGGEVATCLFMGGVTVPDLASGGAKIEWTSEIYNYGGVFALDPGDDTLLYYDEGNTSAIVQVEAWAKYSGSPAGNSFIEIVGLDSHAPAGSGYLPGSGYLNLHASGTDLLDGNPIRVFAAHFDTGLTFSIIEASLAVTVVRLP